MNLIKQEWKRLLGRFIYSWAGLKVAWVEEHSFRFWAALNVLSACVAIALPIEGWSRALILCLGILILAAEAFNTAIERVVNHLSPDAHPLAKAAKDTGSLGVAITAFAAGVAWVLAVIEVL